ncbi:MAG: YdcF family protein [Bacteroidia bacterium]|nr:YdcF family protein [Bacteroidia bacterium]
MKLRKRLKRFIGIVLGLLLAHFLVISIFGLTAKAAKSDLMVILGNKVEESGIPSKRLKFRLEKGLELYQQGLAGTILVSGGIDKEGFDEAKVMADYLIEKGVPAEKIIQDNQGNNTFQSAQNCLKVVAEGQIESVLIVSQYFHLLRSEIAFSKSGVKKVRLKSADYFFEIRDFYSLFRETVGLYAYIFRSYPSAETNAAGKK